MLSERILFSSLRSLTDPSSESSLAIYDVHTYQQVTSFKRSNTARSGLAVTDSHIYAAQADRAVINVYNRQKENLEYTAPFTETFTAIEASHNGAFIAGGTENGRLTIWEIASGRFISTGHIHLQRVTNITFDPTDNFILTGSDDSNVYVWSVPVLTNFSSERKPERILDYHQREITSIVCGRAGGPANIAITASKDLSCIAWNFQTGTFLRCFIFSLAPLVIALDPADRAFYAGFEDGTVQCVDFHHGGEALSSQVYTNKLFIEESRNVPVTVKGDGTDDARARWQSPGHDSPITAIAVMYEGNFLVTGNEKGEICIWDVATGSLFRKILQSKGTITALKLLPPTGFFYPQDKPTHQPISIKPHFDSVLSSTATFIDTSTLPDTYTITTQFVSHLPIPRSTLHSFSASSFSSPEEDMALILDGARQISSDMTTVSTTKGRVEQLESELARMYTHYEALAELHRGLWEKQARWMVEIGAGTGAGEGRRWVNGNGNGKSTGSGKGKMAE